MSRGPAARRRSSGVLALFVALAVLLPGCSAVRGIVDTERALQAAGYDDASVGYDTDSGETVSVEWTPNDPSLEGMQTESHDIARIIWQVAPIRFDAVEVDANDADFTARYTHEELASEYGPRPARLDRSVSELLNVRGFVIGGLIVLFVGLLLIALIVVLIVRSVRKRRAEPRWQPPPPPGQWGAPPPPGPPGQWGAPPPAQPGQWGGPPPPAQPGQWGAPPDDPWQAPPR
jgi:hypothetical protein